MAKTKVVIVYSPNQLARRRVILPDDDSQVPRHTTPIGTQVVENGTPLFLKGEPAMGNLQPGEAVVVVSLADYQYFGADGVLARLFSRPRQSTRCLVVNAFGVVIGMDSMDPQLDRYPFGRLVADPHGLCRVGDSILGTGLS